MNKFYLTLLLSLVIPSSAMAAFPAKFYAAKSALSEGKWVKVGVEKTGVYEISYETLRQMGFENPEKVGVYGRGGNQLDASFTSASGSMNIVDDLKQINVMHAGDKIYFYGLGVDNIIYTLQSKHNLKGSYQRKSRNIYTDRGYYFLSDSNPVQNMTTSSSSNVYSLQKKETGYSFLYHERDLQHNTSGSGTLYWGEMLGKPHADKLTWDVNIPDAIDGGEGYMQTDFYLEKDTPGTLSYGFEGAENIVSFDAVDAEGSYMRALQPQAGYISTVAGQSKIFTSYTRTGAADYCNLDYWLVTYPTRIPTLKGLMPDQVAQQRFTLNGLTRQYNVRIDFPDAATFAIFDITRPANPTRLEMKMEGGTGSAKVYATTSYAELVVFDTSKPQLQISGYEDSYTDVSHQNLHAYSEQGADLLIICIPALRQSAEKLAELHRNIDGIEVVVATTEECYNEFTQGVPDPMAYRSLARMLYDGKTKLKNILLMGPLEADNRGVSLKKDPMASIIAYQENLVSIEAGAYNVNDYYGIMKDYISGSELSKETVNIGVGILPYKNNDDAEIYIEKVKNYMTRTDFAYFLNRQLNIGGDGDNHAHDSQMVALQNSIGIYDGGNNTIHTPVALEAYGVENARKKLLSTFEEGLNFATYFGHGAENMLTKSPYFFSAAHVNAMHNQVHPVFCFAGCSLSNSDRGRRGLGETIVTHTPHGAIASIMATRDTWSGQNMEFYRTFFTLVYRQGTSVDPRDPKRDKSLTLGEIYAQTKSASTFINELAYHLVGDPAIRVPAAYHGITIDNDATQAMCGEDVEISGQIIGGDGNTDMTFNGEAVLRLMEPAISMKSVEMVSSPGGERPEITYADTQVTMTVAKVENGIFTATLHIPASARRFAGQRGYLHIAAYNPDNRLGAGTRKVLEYVADSSKPSAEESDEIAPSINRLEFDATSCSLNVDATDNYALSLSRSPMTRSFSLHIDGKEYLDAFYNQPVLTDGNKAYSINILLDNISFGTHTARVRVYDAAGNDTESEIVFTYAPETAAYTLMAEADHDSDSMLFSFDGQAPARAMLVITDAHGNEVFSDEFEDDTYTWDRTSNAGARLAPGHYKAYIIERGDHARKGHSETIDIPLI